jgi:ABC-type lipoprotein release transport system permease subunit
MPSRGSYSRTALRAALAIVFGAWAVARWVRYLLYEVSATDPLTIVVVATLLAGVALAASVVPGRRAASVDPVRALRAE